MIMLRKNHFLFVIPGLLLVIQITSSFINAQECDWCARRARMGEADAGSTGIVLGASLLSRLAEVLTTPCFHLLRTDFQMPDWWPEKGRYMSKYHPPEYVFTGKYEENLNQPRKNQKPIMSRLSISISYDGDTPELVQTWAVNSPINSYTSCTNRMFENPDAVMRSVNPIEQILWDFERTPATCKMDWHGTDKLNAGQKWNFDLSEFHDKQGRESKRFNRIVVKADKGEILNGVACEDDLKAKAFAIGTGTLEIKYKAPEEEGVQQDTVTIFNSCEICPESKWPMEKTPKKNKIGEKAIEIYRADYTVNIQFSKTWSYERGATHYEGEFKGTITGAFRKNKESQYPMPLFDAAGMTATWNYRDKVTIYNPRQGCETVQSEHAGSGAFPVQSQSRMILTSFQNLGAAAQQMANAGLVDTYQIAVAGAAPEQKISGRYLNDGCKTYRNESLSPPQVAIELRFKMASDKHFSGNKSWSSRGEGTGADASLQCSDLTEKPFNARPFSPSAPGSEFQYNVIWDVTKIKN